MNPLDHFIKHDKKTKTESAEDRIYAMIHKDKDSKDLAINPPAGGIKNVVSTFQAIAKGQPLQVQTPPGGGIQNVKAVYKEVLPATAAGLAVGSLGASTAKISSGRNPAALLAQTLGLQRTVVTDPSGGQRGIVTTPKRGPIDEWQLYREYKDNTPKPRLTTTPPLLGLATSEKAKVISGTTTSLIRELNKSTPVVPIGRVIPTKPATPPSNDVMRQRLQDAINRSGISGSRPAMPSIPMPTPQPRPIPLQPMMPQPKPKLVPAGSWLMGGRL